MQNFNNEIKRAPINIVLIILLSISLVVTTFLVIIILNNNPPNILRKIFDNNKMIINEEEIIEDESYINSPNDKLMLSLLSSYDTHHDEEYLSFCLIDKETKDIIYRWNKYIAADNRYSLAWENDTSIHIKYEVNSDKYESYITYNGHEWNSSEVLLVSGGGN